MDLSLLGMTVKGMTWRRLAILALFGLTIVPVACSWRASSPASVPGSAAKDDGPAFFRDITTSAGIDFRYRNGAEAGHLSILESLGGGVALLDFDGDHRLDIFLPGGGSFEGKEIRGRACKLYRNLGDGKFADVSERLHMDGGWFYSHGAAVGDFDRDGWPDLLLTGWGRLALFHNEAVDPKDDTKGRRFVDVTRQAGLNSQSWSSSAGWADFDGDGYPDLYVCHYVNWSFANHPRCGRPADICPPKVFDGLAHKLFRNNRDGTFTDVSIEAGLRPGGPDASKGLGVLLVDINSDGKPDIYVANDTADSFLYVNRCTPGHFHFAERGLVSGTARDGGGSPNGSMGVDAADYDGSSRPSLFVTNYENELHALYRNECQDDRILFQYASTTAGIGSLGQSTVGWGTGFLDLDHHGWEDLFVATGHAIRYPPRGGGDPRQRPILLRNQGGKFTNISHEGGAYFRTTHLARGVALGDLDDDGRIDLVISHLNEPVVLLRNEAATDNHWLGIELVGRDHADVVGARLILECGDRKQTRFAKGGGSYASSSDRRHVFGLEKATKVDCLTVVWPNGERQHWGDLAIDQYHRLVQRKDKP
ncbi:MAG TPA: CRTAC1 family protein [Gemmataceae bacterium]|nr:CRTAC1 family protein [Gemmataceae bacterium]